MTPATITSFVEQSLDADKAEDIVTISLEGHSSLADTMIIATGSSSRHVAALAEKLRDRLYSYGLSEIRIEGLPQGDWVILDAGDVIVHIFRPEVRAFYNIEKMWGMYQSSAGIDGQITA